MSKQSVRAKGDILRRLTNAPAAKFPEASGKTNRMGGTLWGRRCRSCGLHQRSTILPNLSVAWIVPISAPNPARLSFAGQEDLRIIYPCPIRQVNPAFSMFACEASPGGLPLAGVGLAGCVHVAAGPRVGEIANLAGRVLGEDLISAVDVPGFSRAMMDGYAVRAADTLGASAYNRLSLTLIGEVLPGGGFEGQLGPGQAVRIMTGRRSRRGLTPSCLRKRPKRKGPDPSFGRRLPR